LVIVITRDEAFALPLPERPVVEDRVALFMGLLPGLGSPEEGAARRLYDDLLANALADLPFSVTRLIVIPDGCLNRIPFGALRDRTGVPLASTHEISYAPSATLWAHWKGRDRQRTEAALALSLADPELAAVLAAEDRRESDPWLSGLSLGRLPHARREARELRRNLAAGSVVRAGDDASERFLKHSDLGKFEIVHFASHAIVDPDHPDRSAVLLARGAPDEDGLLQIREIVDLDLDGKTVILSGCRSASGETVAGEGVLGLSRGFFQAGAHAVIGSLWPLRDDDAASLMGEFSKEVARGGSLAGALAAAQRTAIDAGTPTGAWAGWVVLGDGEIVPVPGGVARIGGVREAIVWALAALVMTAALVAVYLSLRRIFLR
jgi:CHAT domain-containing protein